MGEAISKDCFMSILIFVLRRLSGPSFLDAFSCEMRRGQQFDVGGMKNET